MRATVVVAAILFLSSFFLPTASADIRGYEAFWLSFKSWGDMRSWELSGLPLVLAWLANIGVVAGLVAFFGRRPPAKALVALVALSYLAIGPVLVAWADLKIGYYVWACSILVVASLALLASPPHRGPIRNTRVSSSP